MSANTIEAVNPQLQAVVDDAYRIFGGYRLDGSLCVCHCNSCMTLDDERRLVTTPLRAIPAELLAQYTESAHSWDDGSVAREFRYFLPRYLELIALNEAPDPLGIDICLRRLGESTWRETWPRPEQVVIERYFDAILVASLQRLELTHWPAGWRLEFDLADVLTMIVTAGGDLDRVLAAWDAADDPPAAIHMAALRSGVIHSGDVQYFHSAYLEDHKEEARRIGAFLTRPEVVRRIEAAFFNIDEPRLQRLVSSAID